jgi:hypothetical protein
LPPTRKSSRGGEKKSITSVSSPNHALCSVPHGMTTTSPCLQSRCFATKAEIHLAFQQAQQFSGGSFAYRAQNFATVYIAPGFCIFLSPRALTRDPRALPQSFRASEIASAERQGSRKRPDAGHDQPTKARPFANSEEPRRLFSVRLTCRHGRMSTDIERPRPKIVPHG